MKALPGSKYQASVTNC